MASAILDKDTIKSPQRSRLGLSLDRSTLHVMVKDQLADMPLYTTFKLDQNLGSTAKALEEIIYSNPILLSDFAKVEVSLRSTSFVLLPDEAVSESAEFCESVVNASIANAGSETLTTYESPIKGAECTLMVKEERDLVDFIRRTFNNPSISHSLGVLASHFVKLALYGMPGKMYVHLHDDSMDIAIFGDNGLSLLNTFTYSDPMDAVYYIMSTRSALGIEQTSGELFISGDTALREKITPVLREYLGYVMPLVLPPPVIRFGASVKDAPLDLTLSMLCE
ncbi:MAG: DUF3822 family protein [Muribaculum sp.]|nr:DUF3822 family protein [Muribaculum sp.]